MGIPFIVAFAFVLNSCGLTSMISKFESIDFTVTPKEVEVHGGKVAIELDVTVPEKYFNKSATMSFTPKLVWENGEISFKSVILQGEKVSSNGITIGYVTGGKFNVTVTQEGIGYVGNIQISINMKSAPAPAREEPAEQGQGQGQETTLDPEEVALKEGWRDKFLGILIALVIVCFLSLIGLILFFIRYSKKEKRREDDNWKLETLIFISFLVWIGVTAMEFNRFDKIEKSISKDYEHHELKTHFAFGIIFSIFGLFISLGNIYYEYTNTKKKPTPDGQEDAGSGPRREA